MENLPQRKSIRLKNYDYSTNAAYFITICTDKRKCTLSKIRRGDLYGRPEVELTELGKICVNELNEIEILYSIQICNYMIMPNHVHALVRLDDTRATARVAPTTLGAIIGGYKSIVANEYLQRCKKMSLHMGKIWQRNYYEHVIRDDDDYNTKWNYIDANPLKWEEDDLYKP